MINVTLCRSILVNVVLTMSAVDFRFCPPDAAPLSTSGNLPKPISLTALFEKIEEFCGRAGAADVTLAAAQVL